ncbi:MAG: DEAD/DEAH box helicase [Cyanobacteriota bacterium]|nr:DEAD/DEAH box helicase [Cyanobacteriota bacterium]
MCANASSSPSPLNLETLFPFQLDEFQLQAIAALDAGKSVVVCAPTGSGKTLIGEYAIHRALASGRRVFYTTPLKALSNQKLRDFQNQFGESLVGLITGDILVNAGAPVVVMTTEIFRNMLYETPIGQVGTSVRDVGAVVLDECHYLSDRGRGTVWEESIIYCPPHIQLVALSATIGNPQEFTAWIDNVRAIARKKEIAENDCVLIDSDYRPVPLRFYYSTLKGLFPLLNPKRTQINPRLKPKHSRKRRRLRSDDCPKIPTVLRQLQAKDLLPAIYLIFSRRGCEQAVDSLTGSSLVNESEAAQIYQKAQRWCEENPEATRADQIEPLTRGIAAHHAGLLPAWKGLVEQLFEAGLVKVVFATATLAAGINMPARTTVISSLSKRSDDGHRLLTPSEFLQIAGRAGRRGMDTVGHVVTVETPFEGAKEAAYLATANAEPLRSWFTPSYGMVLNLLQKHTIEEVQDLLKRSFAEYQAKLKLAPEQQAIAALTTELAKLDVELAPVSPKQLANYEKLSQRLKEERRLLKILQKQADETRKREMTRAMAEVDSGTIVYLKGDRVPVASPLPALLYEKAAGSGQSPYLICLGANNRWYVAGTGNVVGIDNGTVPKDAIAHLLPPAELAIKQGQTRKGDKQSAAVAERLSAAANDLEPAPEVAEQHSLVERLEAQLASHPLHQLGKPGRLVERQRKRQQLQEELSHTQVKYQRHQLNRSYYWEEFLELIAVLREFGALSGYKPTALGKAAAAIRSENELWLALVFLSGELEALTPSQLAAAIAALITETARHDTECNLFASPIVTETLDRLRKLRHRLNQVQRQHNVALPVWLEQDTIGLVEQWALGEEESLTWNQLGEETSLDDGDIVRMLRRTVDVLLQIPQIPGLSDSLMRNARIAASQMRRFPL